MGDEDRERKFEQALARHLRGDAVAARNEADARAAVPDEAAGAVECLDAATLAAFHERTLSGSEMVGVKEHVAACSRCQEILMQLAATDEIALEAEPQNIVNTREAALSTGASDARHATRQIPGLTMTAEPASALKPPRDISRGRGFKAMRWAAASGAIAAGLLIWIVARDNQVHTLSRSDNVQVAQEQPTEERPAPPRPLPESPSPESRTEAKLLTEQLSGQRKDGSRVKQPAKESGALRAPKSASSPATANEITAIASEVSPRAKARQLPAKPRDYSSLEAIENKPPEISSSPTDVSVTAAASPVSGDSRAQSAAPVNEAAKMDAKENTKATHTFEPHSNGNGTIELLPTPQMAVNDKLEPLAALKKAGFENVKILASSATVRWRALSAGRIEQSVDSGVTWVPQNSGVKVELLAGSAASEAVCWIVGRGGTILRTTDGGGHWSKVISPIGGDVAEVQAVDAMTAEIFGAHRRARFVTHDGGVTWETAKE
jgi:hypothetical protein